MKARKVKDLMKVLKKKGFELNPEKDHHNFYYLMVDGKKSSIYTYFSHGKTEYATSLMQMIKRQLCFQNTKTAEDFFDCPLTKEKYIEILKEQGDLN
ncbi:hypothetical protein [Chryseobacterium sp. JV274]|uniref:hypothetical protein n=1 Tax=Chryseobacterium sp. JV274 TaxID=1932669 RepID=UPI00054E1D03|nr:hypothetical protein [Chryseobacterium sp. JV274]